MSFDRAQHSNLPSTEGTTSYVVSAPTGHLTPTGADAPFASGIVAPPPSGPVRTKPKPSKPRLSKQLSKSLSTPQLRGPEMSDAELDKKRNKLGYQRISIACAHCRRRKIRCLVADDDPEGRCQNCIRLKKECVFYPVDQQAAIDASSEASSKTGVAPSAPSSTISSSPSQGDLRAFEQQGHPFGGGFQRIPSSGVYQSISMAPSAALQPQGNYAVPDHGYPPHGAVPVSWTSQGFTPQNQPTPIRASSHAPQWPRYGSPSIAVDTGPFVGTGEQQQRTVQPVQSFNYTPEQMPQQWPLPSVPLHQPVRSMSVPSHANHDLRPLYHQNHQPPDSHPRAYEPQSGGRMVPVGPNQPGFLGHPHPYMVHHEQRTASVPFGQPPYQPSMQQVQPGWYSDAPSFAQSEEPRAGEGHAQQGAYHVRPG